MKATPKQPFTQSCSQRRLPSQRLWPWALLTWGLWGAGCYDPTFAEDDGKSTETTTPTSGMTTPGPSTNGSISGFESTSGVTNANDGTSTFSSGESSGGNTTGVSNACPEVKPDRYVVMAGKQYTEMDPSQGLLANDSDPDAGMLTAMAASPTSQKGGLVQVDPAGTFTYDPPAKFWGGDEFTYKVMDGQGCEVEGTVLISVHPQTIALADIASGYGGFALSGAAEGDRSGRSVSGAGDVNGDGFADLLVGAPGAAPGNISNAGQSYLVFGGSNLSSVSLSQIQQSQGGLAFDGEASQDGSGRSVSSAGDINGDGFADLLVGAYRADPGGKTDTGRSYVVWGGANLKSLSLSQIQLGQKGFTLDGEALQDGSGQSVSGAGDVNGDGFADFLIGAYRVDPEDKTDAGRNYLVFGEPNLNSLSLTKIYQGQGGFALDGENLKDSSGYSLSDIGDVNGDGFADFLIGAMSANPEEKSSAGRTYVVFGGANLQSLSLSQIQQGQGGFALDGETSQDHSGKSVSSAGDVDGDGFADFLIGATNADPEEKSAAGRTYVVFGGPNLNSLSLSKIQQKQGGFALDGEASGDYSGRSVHSAGDVNGDGFADFLIGANGASPGGKTKAGRSYLVFGGAELQKELPTLTQIRQGQGGFAFDGENSWNMSGLSVSSAGDVNGDSFADLIIGAQGAASEGKQGAGRSYIIYGGDFSGSVTFRPTPNDDHFEGTSEAERMLGGLGKDELLGNGGEDVLYGGPGDDILSITDSAFFRIDGGPGYDTLRLDGGNMHLDLSKIPELNLQNIEAIELHGQGNQLTLEVRDIVANSDTTNTLVIYGKAENTVSADFTSTGFKYNGAIIDGGKFIEYRSGNGGGPLKLWIQADIIRNITVD